MLRLNDRKVVPTEDHRLTRVVNTVQQWNDTRADDFLLDYDQDSIELQQALFLSSISYAQLKACGNAEPQIPTAVRQTESEPESEPEPGPEHQPEPESSIRSENNGEMMMIFKLSRSLNAKFGSQSAAL